MEALVGGFNKILSTLKQLVLKSFNARGSLSPLTERLHLFPNMKCLQLENLSMDGRDLHGLLENLRSSPNLRTLCPSGNPLFDEHRVRSIVPQALIQVDLDY